MANRWRHNQQQYNVRSTPRPIRTNTAVERALKTIKKQQPNEIVGAIKLWIRTELPEFLLKRLNIVYSDSIKINNQSDFSDASRSMTIYFCDDMLKLSMDFEPYYVELRYCDPQLFDHLQKLIARVHNG